MFIPFPRWEIALTDVEEWDILTYYSEAKNVYLMIVPDFEQYVGVGGISFYYSRFPLSSRRSPGDKCHRYVSNRSNFLFPFLKNVPPEKAQGGKLSVHQASERRREQDERLNTRLKIIENWRAGLQRRF